MDAILTLYPLSREFNQRLAQLLASEPIELKVGELRQRPFFEMISYLRSQKVAKLFLPIEDENASVLLPVLKLIAIVIPAGRIFLIEPDLKLQRVSRIGVISSLVRLVYASIAGYIAMLRAKSNVTRILSCELAPLQKQSVQNMLFINANLWFGLKAGGSVGHISGVVNAYTERGYNVDFASAGGRLLVKDAKYIRLYPAAGFGYPWEYNYYRFHFRVIRQLLSMTSKRRFAFIYQRMSLANYSGVVLSRKLGVPLILEYNGSEAWVARNWGTPLREQALAENVEDLCLRHAHLVVTISDVLGDELMQRGVPSERIMIYPNCIDPTMFNPDRISTSQVDRLRARHGIDSKACVITFIGTFGQWHGVDVLAQSIRMLLDDFLPWVIAKNLHFLLVGDGLKMREVRAALGSHAEGPYVTLAGLVSQHEAPNYLAASDILSSPHVPNSDGSRFFGSPTKLFEYMAMGKAIVASDLDQIAQVLSPSIKIDECGEQFDIGGQGPKTAVLTIPGSAQSHAEGIRFLVDRPELRRELGRNASVLAANEYTWKHHVDAIMAKFSELS